MALNLPDVADERPLYNFTQAIQLLNPGFASTQDFYINLKIKEGIYPDIYNLIKNF